MSINFQFKIFEGLRGSNRPTLDSVKHPVRTNSTIIPRDGIPSSYTHLWILSGKSESPVVVPETFVKPNQTTPPNTLEPSEASPTESDPTTPIPAKEEHKLIFAKDIEPVKVPVKCGSIENFIGVEIPPSNSSNEPSPKPSLVIFILFIFYSFKNVSQQ